MARKIEKETMRQIYTVKLWKNGKESHVSACSSYNTEQLISVLIKWVDTVLYLTTDEYCIVASKGGHS